VCVYLTPADQRPRPIRTAGRAGWRHFDKKNSRRYLLTLDSFDSVESRAGFRTTASVCRLSLLRFFECVVKVLRRLIIDNGHFSHEAKNGETTRSTSCRLIIFITDQVTLPGTSPQLLQQHWYRETKRSTSCCLIIFITGQVTLRGTSPQLLQHHWFQSHFNIGNGIANLIIIISPWLLWIKSFLAHYHLILRCGDKVSYRSSLSFDRCSRRSTPTNMESCLLPLFLPPN
jgi:hypothetical protein